MTKLLPLSFDRFPLGNPSFSSIRKEGKIYVDKTDKIVELINSGRYLLLARPSRFGKTLLISTIATIFEEGSSALMGLKAENMWDKRKYPIVRLDFSAVRNWSDRESLYRSFDSYLKTAISTAGFEIDPASTDPSLRWMQFLSSQPDSSVVILIDEYDAPLTAHLDQQEKFQIALDLRFFFRYVKDVRWENSFSLCYRDYEISTGQSFFDVQQYYGRIFAAEVRHTFGVYKRGAR